MSDEHRSIVRRSERTPEEQRETSRWRLSPDHVEELRELRQQDAQALRNWLAAQWPQKNSEPTV